VSDTELWGSWAVGVLIHPDLAAGASSENLDTLWAWSSAETAPYPLMRWFNPMNSTEPWPGSQDSGAQPGPHDVKIYGSLQDGVDATVFTLAKEPYYGAIVANLRASLPRQQWGQSSTAAAELHAWGTGSAWLDSTPYFGALPSSIQGEFDMATADRILAALTLPPGPKPANLANQTDAELLALQATPGVTWDAIKAQYGQAGFDYIFALAHPVTVAQAVVALQAQVGAIRLAAGGLTPAQAQELQEEHDALVKLLAAPPPVVTVDLTPVETAIGALATAIASGDADLDTALANLSSAVADVKTHVAHLT
jgi:hypothetical protein